MITEDTSRAVSELDMVRRKILITGGSGLLALNWACAMRERHDVVLAIHRRRVALAHTSVLRLALDDAAALCSEMESMQPDIIVHTAGITSVEECEREPERARHVYEDLSRNVARAATHSGAQLIHISTDHLFAGRRALYDEQAQPEPVNAYGRTKLLAEQAVIAACPAALVVRTNFFGWGHRYRQSFSDWIYCGLSAGKALTMFDDVFVTPILADRLAASAHRLLDLGASGVYNVVGDERISKYDFGLRLAQAFGLPEQLVQRGRLAASQLTVRRPPDMSLDNAKARALLGTSLGAPTEYFSMLRQQERDGRRTELLEAVSE